MFGPIVTHVSPDLDAICSVWLLLRYGGLSSSEVIFVNTGNPPPHLLEYAEAVVDTGGKLDAATLRFDHHQLPGGESNQTCAAYQVWEHLLKNRNKVNHLRPLIELVRAGDTGFHSSDSKASQSVGIHSILRGFQRRGKGQTDLQTLQYGMALLDDIARTLRYREMGEQMLESHCVWKSQDHLFWAIKDAPEDVTNAAFEHGAHVVLFSASRLLDDSTRTHAIGIWRHNDCPKPHLGDLANRVVTLNPSTEVSSELRSWFKHPAGFFAGRGTAKAPREDPLLVSVQDVARAIDEVWER